MRLKLMTVFLMMILELKVILSIKKTEIDLVVVLQSTYSILIQFTLREDLKDLDLETITVEFNLPFIKPIVLTTLYRPERPVEVFTC